MIKWRNGALYLNSVVPNARDLWKSGTRLSTEDQLRIGALITVA
jgi:hypothetical protein